MISSKDLPLIPLLSSNKSAKLVFINPTLLPNGKQGNARSHIRREDSGGENKRRTQRKEHRGAESAFSAPQVVGVFSGSGVESGLGSGSAFRKKATASFPLLMCVSGPHLTCIIRERRGSSKS